MSGLGVDTGGGGSAGGIITGGTTGAIAGSTVGVGNGGGGTLGARTGLLSQFQSIDLETDLGARGLQSINGPGFGIPELELDGGSDQTP